MAQILTDEELDSILREKYAGPNGALRLAQNLISIFGATHPDGQTVDGPITFRQPRADVPALVVEPFPNATVPALAGGGGGGGETPAQVDFSDFGTPDPAGVTQAFPIVLYGIVQGKVGGAVYQVTCYFGPTSGPPLGTFQVTQGQIDPASTIPSGTEVLVWCSVGSGFKVGEMRMVVPVFLPT
jgi:hypothetical protein